MSQVSMTPMLTQYWCKPISDSNFCGEDVSFSPEFEELRLEIEKSSSMHGTESTDWELVLRLATKILEDQSKDLWALCYGTRAAFSIDGITGCVLALSAMNTLLEEQWLNLYPSAVRKPRRLAPIIWLQTRLEQLLPSHALSLELPETLVALKKEIERLQAVLDERLGDDAPSFGSVRRAIPTPEPIEEKNEPQAAEQQQASAAPAPTQTPHRPTPQPDLLAGIDGDGRVPAAILPQLLRATQEQTQQLAVHYLTLDITDWRAYLLHRAGVWGTINQLPQANASNITQLRPLPRDKSLTYEAAVNNKQYAAILPQLERSAGKAPFWFDGHYLVVRCLEELEAKTSAQVIKICLGQLLSRFPELVDLKYHDGTPFASTKTQKWLEELQQASGNAPPPPWALGGKGSTDDDQRTAENLLHKALAEFEKNGFEAGFLTLGSISTGRSRIAIKHSILQAQYCMAAGRPKAAAHLLQALYEQLESWNLLDWEPELTATILSLLLATKQVQRGDLPPGMIRLLHWLHLDTALETFKE